MPRNCYTSGATNFTGIAGKTFTRERRRMELTRHASPPPRYAKPASWNRRRDDISIYIKTLLPPSFLLDALEGGIRLTRMISGYIPRVWIRGHKTRREIGFSKGSREL